MLYYAYLVIMCASTYESLRRWIRWSMQLGHPLARRAAAWSTELGQKPPRICLQLKHAPLLFGDPNQDAMLPIS